MHWPMGLWIIGASLVLGLAACGPSTSVAGARPDQPIVHADGFDPRQLDLDRPCTLLREVDAERVSNQPFYRTLAANRVEDDRVRCAHAVGAGGLHSLVEATVLAPVEGSTTEESFRALCSAPTVDGPQPDPSAMSTPEPASAPPVPGRNCRLANASYAILAQDRIVIAMVRGGAGEVRPNASRRLAAVLAGRVAVGR